MDVVLLRWPDEADLRTTLAGRGTPRLLLVREGPPPEAIDHLEDWVRVTSDEVEAVSRVEQKRRALEARVANRPVLDDAGVLRVGEAWVALAPVEARLAAALIHRFGAVVSREVLARAAWPAGAPGRNALDVHVLRLRRRLKPLALAIQTVRARGYLLERAT